MAAFLVFATFFAASLAVVVNGDTLSVGNGTNIYQILFSEWTNPMGKTWTGSKCDQVGSKCDTRFLCHVDVHGCNATEKRRINNETWPGPVEMRHWQVVGKSKYEKENLTNFANISLTGVTPRNFCGALLRCQVVDVDPLKNDEIESFIGRLPGCQELDVPRFEKESRFSQPIRLESITEALPKHKRKGKPNAEVQQSLSLLVKVRTWGPDSTRRTSLSGSSVGSGRRGTSSGSSSRSSSPAHHGHEGHDGHNHTTSNGRHASPNSDDMFQRRMSGGR